MAQRLLPLPFLAVLLLAQSATGIAEERKDREFQECPECPVMVGLPAGGFVMGSPASESGRFKNEGPQHFVSIKAFALGKYDITSEEFLTFLKDTGYQPAPCNAMLDMRWQSPGHGKAFPPFNAEPPRWPAVCLDRRMRRVTWRGLTRRSASLIRRRSRAKAVRTACRARRNGNMPHVREPPRRVGGAMRSAREMPTAMAAGAHGITGC